jgi:signal transduction histidine kinase/ligand-binding sensor domain-containing protein
MTIFSAFAINTSRRCDRASVKYLPAPRSRLTHLRTLSGARLLANAILTLAFAATSTVSFALKLTDYEHTAWIAKDGVAGGVLSIGQVPNGMLRLRSSAGYQVFDGVEFHSYAAAGPAPFADPAGAMGQLSPTGAIYYYDPTTLQIMRSWKGRTEVVEDKEGKGKVANFVFDKDGVGWYAEIDRVLRLDGLKLERVPSSWGLPKDLDIGNNAPVIDREGTLWFGSESGLFRLRRGQRKFDLFESIKQCAETAVAPDGTLWCSSADGLLVVTIEKDQPTVQRTLTTTPYGTMLFDSRGGFWIQSLQGIEHAEDWRAVLGPGGIPALQADVMTPKTGLSSDSVWLMREDAEANVWVGTGAGIDRFRATRFTRIAPARRSFGYAMVADSDGSLWAGNYDRALIHLTGTQTDDVAGMQIITALSKDREGRIWAAGSEGLWRKDPGGAFMPVGQIAEHEKLQVIHQIAEDDSGAMWFVAGRRLLRLKDGNWSKPEGAGLPPTDAGSVLLSDKEDQLWFVSRVGVFVLRKGIFREIKSKAFTDVVASAFTGYVRGSRIWIGGEKGLGFFDADVFHPMKVNDDLAKNITGIVETAEGDLWLQGLANVLRISAVQVDAGLKGQHAIADVFDYRDGLRGATSALEPNPTMIEDAGGRLWCSTDQGLFWIDPRSKEAQTAPPLTLMQTIKSDGTTYRTTMDIELAPNPSQVEFKYAAAALSVGERVRFRYRLLGLDEDWQEAGNRRTAYYTRLSPGRHVFEVIASNEQGRWAEAPTSLTFDVQAAWYQTIWCRVLAVVSLLALLLSLYLRRVQVERARERLRIREISAERERIARDLHDTLLQSMQGVILGFEGLATGLPPSSDTRRSIEVQLDRADQLLGEARDRVRDLRTTGDDAIGLREAFEVAAVELEGSAKVKVTVEGKPREFRSVARDRIYLIGREALINAVVHGNGSAVHVRLEFGPRRFTLQVHDNGVGIDPAVLASGARPGHYGLVGMRERAVELGAELTVARHPDGGTNVELHVPATHAFEVTNPPNFWEWLWRGKT